MIGLDIQTGLFLLVAAVLGAVIGWLARGGQSERKLDRLGSEWRDRFEQATREKDKLSTALTSTRSMLDGEKATVKKHLQAAAQSRTDLESMREKANTLTKNLFTLGAARDELNDKFSRSQIDLNAAKQQLSELQNEFTKVQEFYKGQLANSLEQRKALERKIGDAKSEQESLTNLLTAARSEYEAVNKLLASAEARLEDFDALEQQVIALQADNADLRHGADLAARQIESLKRDVDEMDTLKAENAQRKQEAALAATQIEALKRDVAELDTLKAQNKELVHCLKSMETSRKQYEVDAHRYRTQYQQSEKESETLRLKLGDIEKNFVEMQQVQKKPKRTDGKSNSKLPAFGLERPKGEVDDLKQIVGIGKVFEETLHELGVYYFRQIASFGPAEIARINAELKEFRGRIEHDDWIGQAKELHFKKYGGAEAE